MYEYTVCNSLNEDITDFILRQPAPREVSIFHFDEKGQI